MKISIITVCRNSESTIGRTLRSVSGQTYKNIEHIVIDGASTDNTLTVVASEGAHVTKLLSEKDSGIYDAMNKGVQLSTGEIIAFLNADDFYDDEFVLSKIAFLMQKEELDAIYGDVRYFRPRKESAVRKYNSSFFIPDRLGWGWMPAHPALFIRHKFFELYGGFNISYKIAGDFEFIARVFRHPNLLYRHIPETLVRMQLGGVSTSGWQSTLLLNREMMRACKENQIPTNWFKLLSRYPRKALEFFYK